MNADDDFLASIENRRDYRTDSAAVEDGHATRNEQLLYDGIAAHAAALARRLGRPLRVLDVCAASGGCAAAVQRVVDIDDLVLVDVEPRMIAAVLSKPWRARRHLAMEADAVTASMGGPFDVVLMNSAYHHIDDERKVAFLKNVSAQMAPGALVFLGEHFLPDYEDAFLGSYRTAVRRFYTERLNYLSRVGTSPQHLAVIRQTAWYCWQREYEYQVSMRVLLSHAAAADLAVREMARAWPKQEDESSLPADSGSFVMVLRS